MRFAAAREIFNGVGNQQFAPELGMNRAMVAQMIYNYDRCSAPSIAAAFADVQPEHWFADAVGWNAKQEIVKGYGTLFGALDDITREDFVTILYRLRQAQRLRRICGKAAGRIHGCAICPGLRPCGDAVGSRYGTTERL